MNVEILHKLVGPYRKGDIVPVTMISGGYPEADRLAEAGAVQFTTANPTVELPAVPDAVMEMSDDELMAENGRLRSLLARAGEVQAKANGGLLSQVAVLTAQRDALTAELEATRKAATAPARAGRKRKGETGETERADGAAEYQSANPPPAQTAESSDPTEQPSLPAPDDTTPTA